MSKNVMVIGLGDFGSRLARELTRLGYDVLGVELDKNRAQELADIVSKVVQGDSTSPGFWRDLPVRDVDIAIIAFSRDVAASLLTSFLLKKMHIRTLIAKSQGELHTQLLRAIGVDQVIEPSLESARRLTHTLGTRISDYLEVTEDLGVASITVNQQLIGMNIRRLYDDHKVTLLILFRGGRVILQPSDAEEIRLGDTLIVAGKDHDLRSLPGVGADVST